jgi:hypothetical protein
MLPKGTNCAIVVNGGRKRNRKWAECATGRVGGRGLEPVDSKFDSMEFQEGPTRYGQLFFP